MSGLYGTSPTLYALPLIRERNDIKLAVLRGRAVAESLRVHPAHVEAVERVTVRRREELLTALCGPMGRIV